jgi:hypothetical protein
MKTSSITYSLMAHDPVSGAPHSTFPTPCPFNAFGFPSPCSGTCRLRPNLPAHVRLERATTPRDDSRRPMRTVACTHVSCTTTCTPTDGAKSLQGRAIPQVTGETYQLRHMMTEQPGNMPRFLEVKERSGDLICVKSRLTNLNCADALLCVDVSIRYARSCDVKRTRSKKKKGPRSS